jgi:hypothetical protein
MTRPQVLCLLGALGLLGLAACFDFTGAPCGTSAGCPDPQMCVNGTCQTRDGTGGSGTQLCEPCTTSNECAPGLSCLRRGCDGKLACSGGGACRSIAGVTCPQVVNFGACTQTTECAAGSTCFLGRCLQPCKQGTDCYLPSADLRSPLVGSCVTDPTGSWCYPACSGSTDAVCGPVDSYCERFADRTYGYCELGCGGCSSVLDCPPGFSCGVRRCDAVPGCYPPDGGVCLTISGATCPAVGNFGVCTAATDCGSRASCLPYGTSGASRCLQECRVDTDCTSVYLGASYPTKCLAGQNVCAVSCTNQSGCPAGTTCSLGFCR